MTLKYERSLIGVGVRAGLSVPELDYIGGNGLIAEQRIFITADPAIPTYYTTSLIKSFTGKYRVTSKVATIQTSEVAIFTMYTESAAEYLRLSVNAAGAMGRLKVATSGHTPPSGVMTVNDGKLHTIDVDIDTDTGVIDVFVDSMLDYTVTHGAPALLKLALNIEFGRAKNAVSASGFAYFDGVIADPTITDLSNPSNSESWKLDQPHPINTEQSSKGNNPLTYVGATEVTRELYTLNQAGTQWDGELGGVLVIA